MKPCFSFRLVSILALIVLIPFPVRSANGLAFDDRSPGSLSTQMDRAWSVVWQRFFIPETRTFGDYLSSYQPGEEQEHLPTAEEVKRQYPNPCGYSTGMEDGVILGGAMLSILCDRFAVTGDEALRAQAADVFKGLKRCATVHEVPGFVARNVCREDQTSVYINSSRDQYTHFVHGLWKYARSPLADESTREDIDRILSAIADRMIEFVVPENDYDFCRADGTRCPLGICRMWNVQAHEAARLPMIYAAAWEATGNEDYRERWRHYIAAAVEQSATPAPSTPAYALLQMQCSLELLHTLEPDPELKQAIHKTMQYVRQLALARFEHVQKRLRHKTEDELRMCGPDWRTVSEWRNQNGYQNPQWGEFREVWHLTREVGESALVVLMVDPAALPDEFSRSLATTCREFDYEHNASCGMVYHLAAYWKARRHGLFKEETTGN